MGVGQVWRHSGVKKHPIFIELILLYRKHVNKPIDTKNMKFDQLISKWRGGGNDPPLEVVLGFLAQENKGYCSS